MPQAVPTLAKDTETLLWYGRPLCVRSIVAGDEVRHADFFAHLRPEDLRLRFFSQRRDMPHAELVRLVHPDEDREVALIALATGEDGLPVEVATARAVTGDDKHEAEFGITVRSDLKGQGLGRLMLAQLIARVRQRGTQRMACEVLRENAAMRALATRLGFRLRRTAPGSGPLQYVLDLR